MPFNLSQIKDSLLNRLKPFRFWLSKWSFKSLFLVYRSPIMAILGILILALILNQWVLQPQKIAYITLSKKENLLKRKLKGYKREQRRFKQQEQALKDQQPLIQSYYALMDDYTHYIDTHFVSNPRFKDITFSKIKLNHIQRLSKEERRLLSNISKHQPKKRKRRQKIKHLFSKYELSMVLEGEYPLLGFYLDSIQKIPVQFQFNSLKLTPKPESSRLKMALSLRFYIPKLEDPDN